ncbi:unnamed protein product [Clonostachys solani]|uniref:Uncharacterized protein n=1 Tax=Clonostachys solani TaxID=160281 RepID=A0A9N9Z279_9HYPO|nr:unnamed protein product [Clonostachys solani]
MFLVCVTNTCPSSILAIAYDWKLARSCLRTIRAGTGDGGGDIDPHAGIAHAKEPTCNEDNASPDHIAKLALTTITFGSPSFPSSQSLEFLFIALGLCFGSRLIVMGEYTLTQFLVVFLSMSFGVQAAAAFDCITSLLDRLGTAYGSEDLQLLSEQRQRVLRRALIRQCRRGTPRANGREALDRAAAENRTAIAVSRRLGDIRYVSIGMVFADRRIVDRGTQDELLGDRLAVGRTLRWWRFA